jgi:Tfp pilus assembly protein PilF
LSWRQVAIWRDSDALWTRAISEGEDGPTVHIGEGYSLVERGRADEAIPHLLKAIDQEPSAMLPYYTLAFAYDRKGDPQKALQFFGLALERDRDSAAAWNASGSELAKLGRLKDAQTCFEQALQRDPEHPGARMNLGLCFANEGRTDEAVAQYRRALAINPDFSEARCNLAIDLAREGRAAEAAREVQEVLRRDPAFLGARPDLALALSRLRLTASQ